MAVIAHKGHTPAVHATWPREGSPGILLGHTFPYNTSGRSCIFAYSLTWPCTGEAAALTRIYCDGSVGSSLSPRNQPPLATVLPLHP